MKTHAHSDDTLTIHSESLAVGYGRHTIVDGINLRLRAGDLMVLIGANGSGKSTLLKTLAGVLPALSGSVRVLSRAPGATPKRAAYLPQHPESSHTLPLRSCDVVAMGRYAHLGLLRRQSAADRAAVSQAIERSGVGDFAQLPLRELSGGQQQRTHLAQVLAREAEVLLLDEPTAGLDLNGKAALASIIAAERSRGVTVVLATHDLNDAASATSVLLLAQRVVAVGPPAQALSDDNVRECFGFTQPH